MEFENMDVWKRSTQLSVEIYQHLGTLKDWGFRDQLTRSSLSVPSNLAEGLERLSNKECINFLYIAKASNAELRTQIYIGIQIGYIDSDKGSAWLKEAKELSKMISGLIKRRKVHQN